MQNTIHMFVAKQVQPQTILDAAQREYLEQFVALTPHFYHYLRPQEFVPQGFVDVQAKGVPIRLTFAMLTDQMVGFSCCAVVGIGFAVMSLGIVLVGMITGIVLTQTD